MAISKIIEFGGSQDVLVWKHPDNNITTTSQLIVDETHEALLVVNGNAADLFGPGTRTLELPNIPILNKITQIPAGENPFPCKVFYINKVHHLDLLWGTQSPIAAEDPDYQIFIHVMLHGSVAISVGDARKFMLKLVGFRKEFHPEDIITNFRGLISSHVKDCVSKLMINQRVGYFQMNANLMEVSEYVKQRLEQIFDEYGIVIQYFNIESIEVPKEDYDTVKAAKERRAGRIIEGYSWREEQQMDIAKTFAGNEGTMGAMGGMMGGMMGGAMMGGTISELTRTVMSAERVPTQAPPHDVRSASPLEQINGQNIVRAMETGMQAGPAQPPKPQQREVFGGFDVDSDFNEPVPKNAGGGFCSNCGNGITPGQRFCPQCGTALARSCPNCGKPVDNQARFCAQCGTPL